MLYEVITEARIAGAEIVHGDLDAHAPQRVEALERPRRVGDQHLV